MKHTPLSFVLFQPVNISNFIFMPGRLKQRLKIKERRKCNFCHPKTCCSSQKQLSLPPEVCFSLNLTCKKISFESSKLFRGESISTDCLTYFETVKDNTKTKYTDLMCSECGILFFSLFCFKKRVKSWTVVQLDCSWEKMSFQQPPERTANRPKDATG